MSSSGHSPNKTYYATAAAAAAAAVAAHQQQSRSGAQPQRPTPVNYKSAVVSNASAAASTVSKTYVNQTMKQQGPTATANSYPAPSQQSQANPTPSANAYPPNAQYPTPQQPVNIAPNYSNILKNSSNMNNPNNRPNHHHRQQQQMNAGRCRYAY